jgi:anti-sigma factor RsiW
MIACHDIYDRASAFHDDDLSPAEREAYRRHLEACPPCDHFYRSFEATIRRARQALLVEPPPELAEELIRRIREQSTG